MKMIYYRIYFKNDNGRLDEVLATATSNLNDITFWITKYENQQPELLENGHYIAVIGE